VWVAQSPWVGSVLSAWRFSGIRTERHVIPVDGLPLGFELADHSLGLVVAGGEDLVWVLFRVVKSQAADREIDDFMTVPRSRAA
jgi:hypothetical protein